jgi:DNA-binding CsgD family transcriptional regulator
MSAIGPATDPRVQAELLGIAAAASTGTADGLQLSLLAAHAYDRVSDRDAVLKILGSPSADGTAEQLTDRDALLARAAFAAGRHDEARQHLDAGRTRDIDPRGHAAAHLTREAAEFLVNVDGDVTGALERLDGEIGGRPKDDPEAIGLRAIREGIVTASGGRPDIDSLRAAIEGATAVGELGAAADLVRVLGYAALMQDGADQGLRLLVEETARFGSGPGGPRLEVAAMAVLAAHLAGRLVESVGRADELLEQPMPVHASQVAAIYRAKSLALLGRFEGAAAGLAAVEPSVTPDWSGRGDWLTASADVAFWGGRPDRAAALATEAMTVPAALRASHLVPALTLAWSRSELGGPAIDGPSIPRPTPSLAGALLELEALRRRQAGDLPGAIEAFSAAAQRWSRFHVPRWLACRWAAGDAMRLVGDLELAREALASTEADATAIGFEALAVRIRRSLRLAGVRPGSIGRAPRGPRLELTARERQLLGLAGDGLSNIEIARRVGLGRPTVSRMLSNAMAKLGADSRAQAVAMASDGD